jgi:threonine dehydrogenase-like Zn-dependent dehydrogenase
MRVAVMTKDGMQIREQDMPACGADQILVRSLACGICEGDIFHYRVMRAKGGPEAIMGHEGTGVVAAVGARVEGYAEGDVVSTLGGPYAEFYLAAPTMAAPVPTNVEPALALGEPIACCVHAARRFGVRLGDRVAVVGCGFMGLVCLQLARLQGASLICALEPLDWRREMALRLGANEAWGADGASAKELLKEQHDFDVIIEATGVQGGIDLVGDLVAQHGRVVLVGYHQTNDGLRTVNMKQWNYKAIDVVNGHVRRNDEKRDAMRVGLTLQSSGQLIVDPLVTRYPLDQAQRAFEDLANRKEGLYKAVLTVGDGAPA